MKHAIAGLICLGIGVLLVSPGFTAEPEDTAVTRTVATQPELVSLPPMPPREAFSGITERPLFSESRRPDAPLWAGDATSANELREQWRLTGIVMVGGERKALLAQRNGDKQLTLTPGMPLDTTWMLDEIHARYVLMGADGEQVQLDLLEPRDTTPVVIPASSPSERIEGESGTDGVKPLEERTREATQRLQQDLEQNTEVNND